MKEMTKYQFIPESGRQAVARSVEVLNKKLSKLQEYVVAHGETWADVLTYLARGCDHKIAARKEECRRHMDKLGTPSYLREPQMKIAVKDLGESNLAYWRGLPSLLAVQDGFGNKFSLGDDTDVSDETWRVSDRWIDEQLEQRIVGLPNWMMEDFERFNALCSEVAEVSRRGYSIGLHLASVAASGIAPEVEVEKFFKSYSLEADTVHRPEIE